jgi:hypothetical protein
MKKMRNIAKIALFLVLFVTIHAGLRQVYYALITPYDSYLSRQQAFNKHEGVYDVVVLGDSHAQVGVVPKELGSAANLSQLGEAYIVRYYKLRYNLRKNPGKIQTLVMPMDLHSFSPFWGENFNIVSSSRYVNFLDYMWHTGVTSRVLRSFVHYHLFPYADCTDDIYEALPASQKEIRRKAMVRFVRSLAETGATEEQIDNMMTTHYGEERLWLSQKGLLFFNRVKALCQTENIRVIFVRFPVSEPYVEAASQVVPIEEFDAMTQDLVDAWPGAVLLDYRELYFDREDLFTDLNHLNAKGAEHFSRHFREDLVRLGVFEREPETPKRKTTPPARTYALPH